MQVIRLKDDSPAPRFMQAAREFTKDTEFPIIVVSDNAGIEFTMYSGGNLLVMFPVHEYMPGKFVTGSSQYATGRGARVQFGNKQELDHAVSVCANRARRLANA